MLRPAQLKTLLLLVAGTLLFSGYRTSLGTGSRVDNTAFERGEKLTYKVHYGFVNAGKADIVVDDKLYRVKGNVCYKTYVYGRSTGVFNMTLKIRDKWISFIDREEYISRRAYRFIREGGYKLNEVTEFDYEKREAVVNEKNKDRKHHIELPGQEAYDLVSGYYRLRLYDYDNMPVGQVVEMPGVFEDSLYNFRVRYQGVHSLKTKFGEIDAIKLVPIIPENDLFTGRNSVSLWISDDKNRIPLLAKAEMFVGSVKISLIGYQNLRHAIHFKD